MKKFAVGKGEIAVVLAAVLWGCIGIFTRNMAGGGFTSVQIVAVRAFLAVAILFFLILIKDRSLFRIKLRDIWLFIGTGIFSFLFFNICYMSSIAENSLSVACILLYTASVWVALLSIPLFREKLTLVKGAALVICLTGSVLVCMSSSLSVTSAGLIYGLLSGFGYALYTLFGKAAAKKYTTLTITFYTFLFTAIAILPICHVTELPSLLSNGRNILLSGGASILCTLSPYLFYTYGLSKISAGKASVISILEPVVSAIVGAIAFSEALGLTGLIGIVLVLGGLIFLQCGKSN